jgi:uncharacterized protein
MAKRWLFIGAGWLSLSLGIVGIFVPLLPTTPFVLLAAFCFSKSSDTFYLWLIDHPRFGPMIRDWQTKGAIPARAKIIAAISLSLSIAATVLLLAVPPWAKVAAVLTGICVLIFLFTRPSSLP